MVSFPPACGRGRENRADQGRRAMSMHECMDESEDAGSAKVCSVIRARGGGKETISSDTSLLGDLLPSGHLHPARPLAGPAVGLGPLSVDGQPAAVAEPAVGADLLEALDVLGALAAQVALHAQFVVDHLAELAHLVLGEVLHVGVGVHAGLLQSEARLGLPDPVDVGQTDLDALVERDVYACDTCHSSEATPDAACGAGSGRSR